MAWTIGAFTFPAKQEPTRESEERGDGGEQIWSDFNPIGSTKTIFTNLGKKSQPQRLYLVGSDATLASLKAIYDAMLPVLYVSPYNGAGVQVLMRELVALRHRKAIDMWDIWILLVEQ